MDRTDDDRLIDALGDLAACAMRLHERLESSDFREILDEHGNAELRGLVRRVTEAMKEMAGSATAVRHELLRQVGEGKSVRSVSEAQS